MNLDLALIAPETVSSIDVKEPALYEPADNQKN